MLKTLKRLVTGGKKHNIKLQCREFKLVKRQFILEYRVIAEMAFDHNDKAAESKLVAYAREKLGYSKFTVSTDIASALRRSYIKVKVDDFSVSVH